MILYNYIKIFHILSATILLIGIVYCYRFWQANNGQRIQTLTWTIVIPMIMLQLLSGFTMISLKRAEFSPVWISGIVISFITLIASWFAFIYCVVQSQQVITLNSSRIQFFLLILSSLALLSMIFFMSNKNALIFS